MSKLASEVMRPIVVDAIREGIENDSTKIDIFSSIVKRTVDELGEDSTWTDGTSVKGYKVAYPVSGDSSGWGIAMATRYTIEDGVLNYSSQSWPWQNLKEYEHFTFNGGDRAGSALVNPVLAVQDPEGKFTNQSPDTLESAGDRLEKMLYVATEGEIISQDEYYDTELYKPIVY